MGGIISFFAFWFGGMGAGGLPGSGNRIATITKFYNRTASITSIL